MKCVARGLVLRVSILYVKYRNCVLTVADPGSEERGGARGFGYFLANLGDF